MQTIDIVSYVVITRSAWKAVFPVGGALLPPLLSSLYRLSVMLASPYVTMRSVSVANVIIYVFAERAYKRIHYDVI